MSDSLETGSFRLEENDLIKIENQLVTSRRKFLAGSAAVAGMALTTAACGQPGETEKKEGSGQSLATAVGNGAEADAGDVTKADLAAAEKIMGVENTGAERDQIMRTIGDQITAARQARGLKVPNTLAPALTFDPRLPGKTYGTSGNMVRVAAGDPGPLPAGEEDIAFSPLTSLSHWMRTRAISSLDLTNLYLRRIEKHAPKLENFVTVTADLARAQAEQAGREIAAGNYRGPLHGIPYGLKDLADTAGIRTTWGAMPYKDRVPEKDARITVLLREAGAVLLGKTTLGAIAYGDRWFGGMTRNPWNTEEGSSGSSAGSASSTAAGLVGFAIGTETLGSIVSPSQRNGTTGLRPSFGRVSRAGAMALCWSLDKFGPICRGVEDTALVLGAINGYDTNDASSVDQDFSYDGAKSISGMKVGYVPAWFEGDGANDVDRNALEVLKSLGVNLVEISIPEMPVGTLVQGLLAESAAAFEELTLSGEDASMVWQDDQAWPNSWRTVRFLSAVDYITIDRFRRRVMQELDNVFSSVDAVFGPNFAGGMLVMTNFTGQPQLTLRAGFVDIPTRTQSGTGTTENPALHRVTHNVSFWAPLYREENALLLGRALEAALGVAGERPPLEI